MKNKTVVVIDVLRATSTICAALNNGATSVIPVVSVDEALQFDKDIFLIAGERNGQKAEGFDFGNSPSEYAREMVLGKEVVLTTTNGTKCIHASMDASEILVGSFYNLSATAEYLKKCDSDVLLFCSGWKNAVNIEDTLFAGYLVSMLKSHFSYDSDVVEIALDMVKNSKTNLLHYLSKASHAKRFDRLGFGDNTELCMRFDEHPVVVKYQDGKLKIT
ncbi:MAG: 2-phosphosulfolactate phosphatase [Flavobacteriales bacterium]|nr:2-phosphosulfolactate phosphatase [Flavobacteriales bacterium]